MPPQDGKYVIWEDRQNVGFFKALWETWKESVFYPDKFFSHLPYSGGLGSPILYALLIGWFYLVVVTIYDWIFAGYWFSIFSRYVDTSDSAFAFGFKGIGDLLTFLIAPLIIIFILFIASGIYHLISMIFGWAKRDFEATLRAVAYSFGPLAFAVLPVCGSIAGNIWTIVLTIIGLKHMQQTTAGKATLVVLLPMIFCCCLIFIMALFFGAAILALLKSSSFHGLGF